MRLASFLIDDVGTCEELVQEAFVKFALARRGPAGGKEPAYLRSVVLNGARNHIRHRKVTELRRPAAPPDAPSPEAGAVSATANAEVLAALRRLPDRQREVLVLRYWNDLSEAEIAETLGIATGSVKTHAHRGLATLARDLEALR